MSKNILKRAAVVSLAALVTIPNITIPQKVYASIESDRANEGIGSAGCVLYRIVSSSPYGNYTRIVDECGNDALVNTSQWNEYKLLTSQGSPEVTMVTIGWSDETFYAIDGYQLAGQPKVNLSKDKLIKITDPYNCDQLSILKCLGNQLGSSYLFNRTEKEQEIKENNAKIAAEYAAKRAQDAVDQAAHDAEMEINRQMNTKSINSLGQKTDLPYSTDYMYDYKLQVINNSHNKIWASFDNERNYVQQWMIKHGFNSMEELANTTGKEYIDQRNAAKVYLRDISNGTLPPNCSYGDWIRHNLKKSLMGGWNGLAMWRDGQLLDFSVIVDNAMGKLITYEDETNANRQLYEWKLADLPVIASQPNLNLEQKDQMFESLTGSDTWINCISTTKLCKEAYNSYVPSYEFLDMFKSEWDKLSK